MGPEMADAGMSVGMGIAISGGSVSLVGLVISLIVWSLKRNVQHEDDAKTQMSAEVKELVKWRTEMGVTFENFKLTQAETKGTLSQMKETMETSRREMSAYYRDELGKMETRLEARLDALQSALRQDVMRVTDPSLPERVSKLELGFESLRAASPSRKRR